jgi:hypothetical protein
MRYIRRVIRSCMRTEGDVSDGESGASADPAPFHSPGIPMICGRDGPSYSIVVGISQLKAIRRMM